MALQKGQCTRPSAIRSINVVQKARNNICWVLGWLISMRTIYTYIYVFVLIFQWETNEMDTMCRHHRNKSLPISSVLVVNIPHNQFIKYRSCIWEFKGMVLPLSIICLTLQYFAGCMMTHCLETPWLTGWLFLGPSIIFRSVGTGHLLVSVWCK